MLGTGGIAQWIQDNVVPLILIVIAIGVLWREMGSGTSDKQEAPAFPGRVAWSDEGFLGWS